MNNNLGVSINMYFKTQFERFCEGFPKAQIGGHSVDMPVSNPYLTDKIIDEEMSPMFDHQINDKRKWWRL